jgi:hypothetical protein
MKKNHLFYNNSAFQIELYELSYYSQILSSTYNNSIYDINNFTAICIEKSMNNISSILLLAKTKKTDFCSIMILTRALVENICILDLMVFSKREDDEIKKLRFYLYIIDGWNSLLNANKKILANNKITCCQREKTKECTDYLKSEICNLSHKILSMQIVLDKDRICGKIRSEKYYWKFDNLTNYQNQKIEKIMEMSYGYNASIMFEELLSQYVHGLSYSNISYRCNNYSLNDIFTILLSSENILTEGINDKYKTLIGDKNHDYFVKLYALNNFRKIDRIK